MIIGDPYVFSIMIDVVDKWNEDKSFNNGILYMGIGGVLVFPQISTVTLNVEIPRLLNKLKNLVENKDLFYMQKEEAFAYIYKLTFPCDYEEGVVNDYSYDLTPYEYGDKGYFVFMVKCEEQVRILASKLQYILEESTHNLEEIEVIETYVLIEELEMMYEELNLFYLKSQE